jgi:hypothetical protein
VLDEHPECCFIVRDANGQALAYVHFEEEPSLCKVQCLVLRLGGSNEKA